MLAFALVAVGLLAGPVDRGGMIYVGANAADGTLRSGPSATAGVVAHLPHGMRVIYRKVVEGDGGRAEWYWVATPGITPGWMSAAESSDSRPHVDAPTPVPAASTRVVKTGTVMTAAARGLDSRTKAATQQDEQKSLQQFASFEKHVNGYFDDPEDAKGIYPTTAIGNRKEKARQFREGRK